MKNIELLKTANYIAKLYKPSHLVKRSNLSKVISSLIKTAPDKAINTMKKVLDSSRVVAPTVNRRTMVITPGQSPFSNMLPYIQDMRHLDIPRTSKNAEGFYDLFREELKGIRASTDALMNSWDGNANKLRKRWANSIEDFIDPNNPAEQAFKRQKYMDSLRSTTIGNPVRSLDSTLTPFNPFKEYLSGDWDMVPFQHIGGYNSINQVLKGNILPVSGTNGGGRLFTALHPIGDAHRGGRIADLSGDVLARYGGWSNTVGDRPGILLGNLRNFLSKEGHPGYGSYASWTAPGSYNTTIGQAAITPKEFSSYGSHLKNYVIPVAKYEPKGLNSVIHPGVISDSQLSRVLDPSIADNFDKSVNQYLNLL